MKKIYFTVGPSQVYPKLYKYINQALREDIPSLSHRGAEFKTLFQRTTESLKELLNIPQEYQIFFVSSALEAMERTILGCVEKNSFHLITGSFGKAWASYAGQLRKKVSSFELTPETKNPSHINIPKDSDIICITQNDTSTGFWIPMDDIYALKKKNPQMFMALDVVSSIPYVDIDFKKIDVTFFSVQKGVGLPAGLAVMIVSPKALQKAEEILKKGISIGSYHSLKNLAEKAANLQTPETPNVLNIYLLNKVLEDMLKKGLVKLRKEIDEKAKVLYKFFENYKNYSAYIKNPKFRSPTTLVIDVKGESEELRKAWAKKGFIVGAGYGDNKLNHIRIANFPSHNLSQVKQMLKYTL